MLKVFLVEDERVIREGFRDRIPWEQYGFRLVGEANDGEMALPLIRKLKPDVLITDIKMPKMNGLELAKWTVYPCVRSSRKNFLKSRSLSSAGTTILSTPARRSKRGWTSIC